MFGHSEFMKREQTMVMDVLVVDGLMRFSIFTQLISFGVILDINRWTR
jgi:hypothetical protein